MVWHARQAYIQLHHQEDEFVAFVEERLAWSRKQAAHTRRAVGAPTTAKATEDKLDFTKRC